MIGEIAANRQFTAIERRVTKPVVAVLCHDLQRHEVPAWAAYDDFRIHDSHFESSFYRRV